MFVNLWSWQAHEGTASILHLLVTPVGPCFEKTTKPGFYQHLPRLFKIKSELKVFKASVLSKQWRRLGVTESAKH